MQMRRHHWTVVCKNTHTHAHTHIHTQNQTKIGTKQKYSSLKMRNKVIFQIYESWENLTLAESY